MELQSDKIKAIAIDLDGTVLGDNAKLSGRARRALGGCIARGLRVIIATGRCMKSAEAYRAAIGAEGPAVYYNGAMTLYMPARATLEKHTVGQEAISCCADIARAENIHFQVFICRGDGADFSETLVAEKPSDATKAYMERTGLDFMYGDLNEAMTGEDSAYCVKGIFIDKEAKLRRVQRLVHERLGNAVNTMTSADFILEVLAGGVTKASGLRSAMAFYGLRTEEIIAFGDEENDIGMLSFAGYSVAPANARKSVQDAADLVVGANTDDGVARFLEKTFALS
ncbi:MAG: Cof-type HAD-IIB family hydrolase [Spirochaetaceae bacterium]|jgi:Cof subfamily protein (haloacid dehalogenase superfamily)|nr:Cof-type HAD-IIB family hydrolase [Spirochaetaceae bacterium]